MAKKSKCYYGATIFKSYIFIELPAIPLENIKVERKFPKFSLESYQLFISES
jgi:hypothetical protein